MKNSEALFQRAKEVMPGGVNSPVRAFKSVGMTPRFIEKAKGNRIYDVEGNEYIDYVGSWGPMILGHAEENTLKAVKEAADKGLSFGACTEAEVEAAELITSALPYSKGLYGEKQAHKVRRVLPRSQRQHAGKSGFGSHDIRFSGQRRGDKGRGRGHAPCRVQ